VIIISHHCRGVQNVWPVFLKTMTSATSSKTAGATRGPYETTKLSPEHKLFMTRLERVLIQRLKLKKTEIAELYAAAGCAVPDRTARRWSRAFDNTSDVETPSAKRGRPASLDDEQKILLFGYVLDQLLKQCECLNMFTLIGTRWLFVPHCEQTESWKNVDRRRTRRHVRGRGQKATHYGLDVV
jgi:hypothetical protein